MLFTNRIRTASGRCLGDKLLPRRHAGWEFKVRKILVPVDFSNCALAGLIYGASLAKHRRASTPVSRLIR